MKTRYESGVGSINWAANNTRPDLAFSANALASKTAKPIENDFKKLIFCFGYIELRIGKKLIYSRDRRIGKKGEFMVENFSDASFAPESDVKLTRMALYVNRNLVMWLSKKQKNITRSTAASELVASSIAEEDRTVHLMDFMRDLDCVVSKANLYEDNQAVIACCHKKSISHTRKSVDIWMKIIRERLSAGFYHLDYVNSEMNVADMFTKALPAAKYQCMARLLFLEEEELDAQEKQAQYSRSCVRLFSSSL